MSKAYEYSSIHLLRFNYNNSINYVKIFVLKLQNHFNSPIYPLSGASVGGAPNSCRSKQMFPMKEAAKKLRRQQSVTEGSSVLAS